MVAPCVVLVINDNPYILMVALSYTCRFGPYVMLDLHMLEPMLKEEVYMLIKAKCKIDQHTRLGMYHEGSYDLMVW